MGCASSTEVTTDPHTGQKKTKTKLGGAYPGNRRKPNAPYQPPASAFSNGQATAHFVRYGGGNALVLQQGGIAQPQVGASPVNGLKQPEYIQVTLPDGVYGGQVIQVQAPDGRLNEIIVPDGFGPGSTFTVEFADAPAPPTSGVSATTGGGGNNYQPYVSNNSAGTGAAAAAATTGPSHDDGFASGFNNPTFTTANATSINNNDNTYGQFPSADDARPVYSAPPSYPANPY